MRIVYLFFIATGFLFFSVPQKVKKPTKNWKLYWSEEFNYKGLPDSTIWTYEVGGNGWGNNELEYYTRSSIKNAEVSNGTLKIRAIRENMEGRNYTSARLVTKGKKEFTYGKIDIRAKLPAGRGLWPAVWMLGSNIDKVGWPECGEIDIMEHVGYIKDSVLGTIHTKAYNHVKGTQRGGKVFILHPYDKFHIYSVEWTPEKIDFYLDNNLFYHFENEHKTTAEWPFSSPCFLILNVAIGGNLGGKMGVDENIFPGTLEVDYIRMYERG